MKKTRRGWRGNGLVFGDGVAFYCGESPSGGQGSPGVQSFLLWWGQSPAGRYL